jgi:ATP-dependent DNA helicase RecG
MVHSKQTAQESEASLTDIKEGRAAILVATTRVEVGITIPELRHVILYGAERFGLTTSHQIRGRLARIAPRDGGVNWGKCDLFLPNDKVNDKTLQRLQILVDSNDGFEISEKDMLLRGVGDIEASKDRQHGRTASLIKNVKLPHESIGVAVDFLANRT